ncbi:hypothetical protein BpHYR1_050389 [Brachionus plicatilis]|uniref:Uncharacterized protein n=1 Tax=Brachionus plicatilis TaxID=10195 RepID=A0A3M7PL02_BRAPC|nr:hypothetical protein BpHYR1_050389 [Brachionus plicatilis]
MTNFDFLFMADVFKTVEPIICVHEFLKYATLLPFLMNIKISISQICHKKIKIFMYLKKNLQINAFCMRKPFILKPFKH